MDIQLSNVCFELIRYPDNLCLFIGIIWILCSSIYSLMALNDPYWTGTFASPLGIVASPIEILTVIGPV